MAWRAPRAHNVGLTGERLSDYFSESSAESDLVESEEEESGLFPRRLSRSRVRVPPRYPRPHSHLLRNRDGQRGRGNKHARRWENSMFISSLHQLPEEELERGYSILPDHFSPLTKLHTDDRCMQVWHNFTACSEEEQSLILTRQRSKECVIKRKIDKGSGLDGRREECSVKKMAEGRFKKIDRHIQVMMKHNKHLPLVFLQELEEELTQYFMSDPSALVVALQPNTFYRLLIHGLCQYMGLASTTDHKDRVSIMVLECTTIQFTPPPSTLADYLTHKT